MPVLQRGRPSSHATWAWNLRNGYLHWSVQMEAMHGLPPAMFPGTPEASQAFLHPEDRSRVVDALGRGIESRTPHLEIEYRILRLDGGIRRVRSSSYLLVDEAGTPAVMTGRCLDVDLDASRVRLRNFWLRRRCLELARRSWEAFGARIQRTAGGVVVREGESIFFASDSFAGLVGPDEGSALAAKPLAELIAPGQVDLLPRHAPGGPPARLRLVRPDGTEFDES